MAIWPLTPTLTAIVMRQAGVELVAFSLDGGLPVIAYWGADLGDLPPEGVGALIEATRQQVIGNPVDALMPVSVLPEQAVGWLGTPGMSGSRLGVGFAPHFHVTSIIPGAADPVWPDRVVVVAADDALGLDLLLELDLSVAGLARMRATLTNQGDRYQLDALTLFYPVPAEATALMDFTGHWAKERIPQSGAFTAGTHLRESRRGRTGFDTAHVLMAGTTFANRTGRLWATHVGWSGSHRELAERSPHGLALLGGGALLEPGEIQLDQGNSYTSPWVYGAFSAAGLDSLSSQFHATLRARPKHPIGPRPVTLNSWQAVYFDHDLPKLTELARVAAAVGVERFVLDDGWFGGRRDDTSALGDWVVSADAWPEGLTPLTDLVTSLGLEFGLWVEPEMVSPDSDLARAHPDWIAATPTGRSGDTRHQQVLNLTNRATYTHVRDALDALLGQYPITYLKWDHNRDLVLAGDSATGRPIAFAQTEAAYRLMDELRARHPRLEIESCASGGARIDLGMADHADRFWVSDDIDALERQTITRWTNLLIPYELLGTHVEAAQSHTTGRTLGLDFRAATALFGHFGLEWDLTELDEGGRATLAAWISTYKEVRHLIATGTAVHADWPEPAQALHGVVSSDRRDALFAWVSLGSATDIRPGVVRLPGLDPARTYHVGLQPPSSPVGTPAVWGGPVAWLNPDGLTVPGSVLTEAGLAMPALPPEHSLLLRVTAAS